MKINWKTIILEYLYMLVPLLKFKLYRNFFRLFERGVKGQFHQLSMCSFYVRRSRKRNISVKSSVSFNAFGIRTHKSCTKNVDEIDTRSQPCFKLLLRVLPKNRGSILRSLCGMYCILVSTINDVTIFKGFRRQRYCPQYQKNNIVRQLNYRKDILNNSFCLRHYVRNGLSYLGEETRPTLCKTTRSFQLSCRS